ncbi:MAG: hypothetical protein JW778_01580 [Candidatus Altiarchaeota archaeon]|nr:hypothetical protein [Candidatus Altiarchaeota archaeon]
MDIKKSCLLHLIFSLMLICASADAASNATIHGYVIDTDTGKPLDDIAVEIFSSTDHSKPVVALYTDIRGYYNTSVPAGDTYDIYVRLGNVNPRQTVYIGEGYIQKVDFDISVKSVKSVSGGDIVGGDGFLIVVIVAVIILAVILVDQLYLRKRRMRELEKDLEAEKKSIEEKLAEGEPMDEISVLKKEKARIEYMINITKTKYHKRKIDEESFREIMRDYQKSLIEIEAKIKELSSESE